MKTLFLGHYEVFLAAYAVILTLLALGAARALRRPWSNAHRAHALAVNLCVAAFSTLYSLLILEGIVAYAFDQSDGYDFTLASKRWFARYWRPINSYGYRDWEPIWRGHILFVVGDSFAAGHGIKDIHDRFAGKLAAMLPRDWTVATLARNGWEADDYLTALRRHDRRPSVVIVSYFINDIQHAADRYTKRPELVEQPFFLIRPFVRYTYLLNWLYWRVSRLRGMSNRHWDYLARAYADDRIWRAHAAELDGLLEYARQVHARICFLVWPNLADVAGSRRVTDLVVQYLRGKGVDAVDLTTRFEGRNPKELTVSPMDAHPCERVHAEVAELLFRELSPWK